MIKEEIIKVSANKYSEYLLEENGKVFSLNYRRYITCGLDKFSKDLFCYKLNSKSEPITDKKILIKSRSLPKTSENYRNFG